MFKLHPIKMIVVIMLLLFLSINPLVHGQEILNTVVESRQKEDNNKVKGKFSFIGGGYGNTVGSDFF